MQSAVVGAVRAAASRYRWTVCALLFFATVINYMDRQILGLLAPMLQHDIGWSQVQYGRIVMAFSAFYALGLLGFGGSSTGSARACRTRWRCWCGASPRCCTRRSAR